MSILFGLIYIFAKLFFLSKFIFYIQIPIYCNSQIVQWFIGSFKAVGYCFPFADTQYQVMTSTYVALTSSSYYIKCLVNSSRSKFHSYSFQIKKYHIFGFIISRKFNWYNRSKEYFCKKKKLFSKTFLYIFTHFCIQNLVSHQLCILSFSLNHYFFTDCHSLHFFIHYITSALLTMQLDMHRQH